MPLFKFKARNMDGNEISRTMEACNAHEVLNIMRDTGYYVISLKEKNNLYLVQGWFKVSGKQISIMCKQLQVLLSAGISVYEALYLVASQTKNIKFKKMLLDACQEIQRGKTLHEALLIIKSKLPKLLLDLISVGEHSGALECVLTDLSQHYDKEDKLQKKVINSLYYPCFVLLSAVFVSLFLMLKIVPVFADTLESFNAELPKLTLLILKASTFISYYYGQMIFITLSAITLIAAFFKTSRGKKTVAYLSLKLPYIREFYLKISLTRFCRYTSLLLKSGISIVKTLEISCNLISNVYLKAEMEGCINNIKRGKSLSSGLESIQLFDSLSISMIYIGEHSGNLDFMLSTCAEIYDDEIDNMIKRITALIEPVIIVLLAIMVGTIVLSVILPIFNTMNAIG